MCSMCVPRGTAAVSACVPLAGAAAAVVLVLLTVLSVVPLSVSAAGPTRTRGHPFDFDGESEPWWPEEHITSRFHTEAAAATWSYNPIDTVNYGPLQWATYEPTCSGQRQSPIDIQPASAVYRSTLTPLTLSVSTLGTNMIVNNGHAIQVNANANDSIVLSGGNLPAGQVYKFTQMHFHTNSEHTINGGLGAAELHFVFSNAANVTYPDYRQLAVVGVIFKAADTDNAALTPMINLLKQGWLQTEGNFSYVTGLTLAPLIVSNAAYYTYNGSLTTPAASGNTPGCAETVTWHVLAQLQTASLSQIAYLHNALNDQQQPYMLTNRPVQPLAGRTVLTNIPPTTNTISASARNAYSGISFVLALFFCLFVSQWQFF